MRRWLAALALVAAGCTAQPAPAPQARQSPSELIGACMSAAHTRDAMIACKGTAARACLSSAGGQTTAGQTTAGQTTAGQTNCYSSEANAWQRLLDQNLEGLEGSEPTRNDALSRVNETWLVWRDAECRYRASANAGRTLADVTRAACVNELTADRAIDLNTVGGE